MVQNCENCKMFSAARESTREAHLRMGYCMALKEPNMWVRSIRRKRLPELPRKLLFWPWIFYEETCEAWRQRREHAQG